MNKKATKRVIYYELSMNCASCGTPISLDACYSMVGRSKEGLILPGMVCQRCRKLAELEEFLVHPLASDLCCWRCGATVKLSEARLLLDDDRKEIAFICAVCNEQDLRVLYPSGYLFPTVRCVFCRKEIALEESCPIPCQTEQGRLLEVHSCPKCFEEKCSVARAT